MSSLFADHRSNGRVGVLLLACVAACGGGGSPAPAPAFGSGNGAGGSAATGRTSTPGSRAAGAGSSLGEGNSSAAGSSLAAGDAPIAGDSAAGDAAAAGSASTADASSSDNLGSDSPIQIPWDWAGIIGTGQSLAVGEPGGARGTPAGAVRSTTQAFNNLKLSTGNAAWPVNPNDPALTVVPLVEPIGRLAPGYPSSWPTNIAGETPHAAMAHQLTTLVKGAGAADYLSVHGEVGENGQCLSFLMKGATPVEPNGHAYQATLIETQAITRLARSAGKTYGIGAITVTHGECDANNANYGAQLHQLWLDYSSDLPAITGQTQPPLLIVSQQNAVSERARSTLQQWRIGVDYPNDVVCSGPKYQYPYTSDAVHLVVDGYQQLGEKYAQVYYERVVRGRDWHPLEPIDVRREGRVIHVKFHVPVPPLMWEDTFQAPHQASLIEWAQGKGFEVHGNGGNIPISSVAINGDSVDITCAADLPAGGVVVGYALSGDGTTIMTTPFAGTKHWGLLRDSDPFVGRTTNKPQPNFAVAFELPVPG
jgi:hypothetical protein